MATFTLKTGQKTVAAAATPEPLTAARQNARNLKIKALSTNTNPVYVGSVGLTSATGYPLSANQEADLAGLFQVDQGELDLNTVYCRVTTNGEGVAFYYA